MIDVDKLHRDVLKDVAQSLGWEVEKDDLINQRVPQEYIDQISIMGFDDVFEHWCTWNGFIGWAHSIDRAHTSIMMAEFSAPKPLRKLNA